MATRHDQLMKELIAAFPDQFLRLAAPELAEQVDLDTVAFEPEEHYPGTPAGRERRPDLVSRVRTKAACGETEEGELLIHVEIELRYRRDKLPGLLSYHRGLSLKYALPVHTIVLYLRGGRPGPKPLILVERSLSRVVGILGLYSLGLSRLPAADYLARPEPLAWAFAALAQPASGQSRPELGLACLQKITAASELGRYELELLIKCVLFYGKFEDHEAPEFDRIMTKLDDREVQEMTTTMVEWWQKEARKEGRKEGEASLLKRQLRRRFQDLPDWLNQRLEQASQKELETWADRVLDAKRLEDVFSPA